MTKTVLISGASIAGPATALWFSRLGYDVTVVEQAPSLREGGQAIDFKGRTQRTVLERMGVWDAVCAAQTGKTDMHMIDGNGKTNAVITGEFLGGDVEILRGDLTKILYDATKDSCEYVFGDSVTALRDTAHGVEVEFKNGPPKTYDLVIGADGTHSAVRRLAFGPEQDYVDNLGHYYAVCDGDIAPELEWKLPSGRNLAYGYNEPGRLAVLGGSKAPMLFVFAADAPDYDRRDRASQKAFLAKHYKGAGWKVPQMIEAAMAADDFYLDSLSRSHMTTWTRGRVALVGDAGYANTLGGFGNGLAMLGAYVLAGELHAAQGDHERAFVEYDKKMLGPTKIAREASAGPFLAPGSWWRIRARNHTFWNPVFYYLILAITNFFATDDTIVDYGMPGTATCS